MTHKLKRLHGSALALLLAAPLGPAAAMELRLPPARAWVPPFAAADAALSPEARLRQALRDAGQDARQVESVHLVGQPWRNAMGISFVRAEQVVDGVPVQGSYVRAAIAPDGQVRHLALRLAPATTASGGGTGAGAAQAGEALRVAMERIAPQAGPRAATAAQPQGRAWRFERSAHERVEPRVTAVLLPTAEGRLVRGWRVETHLRAGNQAHTTLVGPEGQVLQVTRRTADAALRVFPNSPAAGPAVIVQERFGAASPQGWVDPLDQSSTQLSGNNAIVGTDQDGDDAIDGGGYAIFDGQFTVAADLSQSPTTPRNRQASVQNAMALVNRIHDTLWSLGYTEAAANMQRNNFQRGGSEGDRVFVTLQDWNADANANFAVSFEDGGYARMQVGLQPSPLPTHEVQVGTWTAGAKAGLFGPALGAAGVSGVLVRPSVSTGCSKIPESLQGQVALLVPGACTYADAVTQAQQAGAVAAIMASPAPANHAFRMTGTTPTKIPALQVGADDAQRLAGLAGQRMTLRAKAQQPPMLDGALDADLVFHEYTHGMSARLIGDMTSTREARTIYEAYSDTVAFLLTGNDRFAAYAFSESCFKLPGSGCRRAAWTGYPGTYADLRAQSIYDDSEVYTAAMWRLKELLGAGRERDLLAYVIDGMHYTPPAPGFEQARDGLLAAVANGPRPADCALVWKAFAQFGLGQGSSATWTAGSVRTQPSTVAPLQCP